MVDTTGGAAARRTERLELRVPTSRTQLPAVRAMTGDLAMRMDFDLDAVEDLRLAVDEASATLSSVALPGTPLVTVFETGPTGLTIQAWVATTEGTDVPRDGFGWAVIAALVDSVDAGPSTQAQVPAGDGSSAAVATITLTKELPAALPTAAAGGNADLPVTR
ncbi:serine/threonine-protein kinase RsbW [Klenkia marina]|uniref:Serine/threonine-protein kinase RsbW n=1 Tax=Klenkia marina TaxID=1960309 RepID=A0A1G4YQG7_9ACTN|nr:anti-sigma regulatory factor [Klenkia marina]SCX55693.1 serine/threonine-protein kinase RsbW [Klenkia marina]